MKRMILSAALTAAMCLALSGCFQDPPASTAATTLSPEEEARRAEARENARKRGEFKESELLAFSQGYLSGIFEQLFPERDIAHTEFIVYKDIIDDAELEPVTDSDKALELFRTGNFRLSFTLPEGEEMFSDDEIDKIMQALSERGFTIWLDFGDRDWEYYLIDGEIFTERVPMY
ncbi:MAG: hypothetical protein IK093_09140 [Ruminiclostridium sp.]|nr:hypothetical protein [Ruminiclostridium sp.]